MEESVKTYVPGTRTAPIQYEKLTSIKKPKKTPIYQPVRQGNKKYTISPIYDKVVGTQKNDLEQNEIKTKKLSLKK